MDSILVRILVFLQAVFWASLGCWNTDDSSSSASMKSMGAIQDDAMTPADSTDSLPIGTTQFARHAAPVHALVFDREGQNLFAASADGLVKRWEIESKESTVLLRRDMEDYLGSVHRLAISGNVLLMGVSGGLIIWVDIESNRILAQETLNDRVTGVAASAENTYAVVGGSEEVLVYNAEFMKIWHGAAYKIPYWVEFSASSDKLLVATWNGYLFEESYKSKASDLSEEYPSNELPMLDASDTMPIFSTKYLDGDRMVAGEEEGLFVFSKLQKQKVFQFNTQDGIHQLAVSSDGKRFAAGGNEQTTWIWDAETYALLKSVQLGQYAYRQGGVYGQELVDQLPEDLLVDWEGEKGQLLYPESAPFYDIRGPHAVCSLVFHPTKPALFVGTHSGQIFTISY